MTVGVDFMPGETAAELTGLSISEIDEAAATGVIPAHFVGWQLLVDPSPLMPPEADASSETAGELSWDDFTVAELRAALDARQIAHSSKAHKADLVALLSADDESG